MGHPPDIRTVGIHHIDFFVPRAIREIGLEDDLRVIR
jgi:hypothetical protein